MLKSVLLEFISDMLYIVPTGVILTGIFVGLVCYFDIEPIKTWLFTED